MVTYHTYSKLNITLSVFQPLQNGYHPISSVFQSISLYDTLQFIPQPHRNLQLTCSHPAVPCDSRNLILRILHHFEDHLPHGVHVKLTKTIPIGGGLGGGSGNAAATLDYLNHLLNWHHTPSELAKISESFGADIPFFFRGGRAKVEGFGEQIHPQRKGRYRAFILILPDCSVSTAEAFNWFDHPLNTNPLLSLPANVRTNDLIQPVFDHMPQLLDLWYHLKTLGYIARMSGSGSTLFLPFLSLETAQIAMTTLKGVAAKLALVTPTSVGYQRC